MKERTSEDRARLVEFKQFDLKVGMFEDWAVSGPRERWREERRKV